MVKNLLSMKLLDKSSRLVHLQGDSIISTAYGSPDDEPKEIGEKRVRYLARVEIAQEGHPEVLQSAGKGYVITTWKGIYFQKRPRRGPSGEPISFEELVRGTAFPNRRADGENNFHFRFDPSTAEGRIVDCNVVLYSEFDGHWEGFGRHFDESRTYQSVIDQLNREISDLF